MSPAPAAQSNAAYCGALVRDADFERYAATLFVGPAPRRALLAVFAFNMAIILVSASLARMSINWANAVVFQALLALIVTLFDRFQPYHRARFPREGRRPARGT